METVNLILNFGVFFFTALPVVKHLTRRKRTHPHKA